MKVQNNSSYSQEVYDALNVVEQPTVPTYKKESGFERVVNYFAYVLAFISGACITAMILLIVGNSIVRVFADPFSGTAEVVGWLAAISLTFSLGYTQIVKGHVDIDLLVNRFNPVIQKIIQAVIYALSIIFFTILGWQLIIYANSLIANGTLSTTLRIPFYPLVYLVAVGFIGLTLTLVIDLIKLLKGGE
ncbi:TRAP transporter small permease [Bacillus sp. Marseille-P3661]|uniref:TRAP transporter small permease n=1 Tax=Bacillus sp. Marseille-P3661 TaxID=1936234 RepID=UPI000C864C25|nr:TRAP transporter small permease [Bacillus sp. Marseille-P3661]